MFIAKNSAIRTMVYTCLSDARTQTCRNISLIGNKLGFTRRDRTTVLKWDPLVFKNMQFVQPEAGDYEKINTIQEITNIKRGNINFEDDNINIDDLDTILTDICEN